MGSDGRRTSERLYDEGRWRHDADRDPRHELGPLGWTVWRAFLRFGPPGGVGLLTDVGGGEGYFAALWPGAARRVVVDVVPAALAVARSRGLWAIAGDARALPFREGVADLVLCSDLLEHLPATDVPAALAALARVLKPGGVALVHTSVYGFYLRRWFKRAPGRSPLDADDLKDGHLNRFRPGELEALAAAVGLRLERRVYYKHFFQPLTALATRAAAGGNAGEGERKTATLRSPLGRAANAVRVALAQLDVLVFGWWLPGGAAVYKLVK